MPVAVYCSSANTLRTSLRQISFPIFPAQQFSLRDPGLLIKRAINILCNDSVFELDIRIINRASIMNKL